MERDGNKMKVKKVLLCGIVALLSVPMMAASAQSLLRQARDDYYKSLKTPKVSTKEVVVTTDNDNDVVEEEVEVKPKTPIEKLEYNAAKAADRVDFYERVVRSVQREEQELGEFKGIINGNKVKKSNSKTTKTTKSK